jgi:3'(2'), 5'-bisphosphate nucleotidase
VFEAYSKEADFALSAVRTAARLCRRIQGEMVTEALEKKDRSPVTIADFASQAVVARLLMDAFPEDALVAEEDSAALKTADHAETLDRVAGYVSSLFSSDRSSTGSDSVCDWIDRGNGVPEGRFWVLDPIDGTKGFLRGDQYVVALSLVEKGRVVLGALGCPNLDRRLSPDKGGQGTAVLAVRGQGAWVFGPEEVGQVEPTRLNVSGEKDPARARVLRSFESGHTDGAKIEQVAAGLGTDQPPVRMDSQAKFAILAAGGAELLFRLLSPSRPDYMEKIWDQAAGSVIVEEAGGRVSDLAGRPLNFNRGRTLADNVGILVSNGPLHDAALEALRRVGAHVRPR